MPLPSSGEIKVSQVNVELGRAYNAPNTRFANGTTPQTGTLFKLGEAGTGVNQTAPHALSEFYDYSIITTGLSGCLLTRTGQYTTNSYEDITYDLSSYTGMRVRFVWHYVSGSSYTGDVQIDNFSLETSYNSTQYYSQNFNGEFISGKEFQTSSADTSAYTSVSFSNLAVGGTALKWNLDSSGTSSGSTGLTTDGDGTSSRYVYAEVSSPGYPNKNFWLRSFEINLPPAHSEVKFKMARYGSTIGTVCLHIDVLDLKPPYFVHQSGAYNISDNQGSVVDSCGGDYDINDEITFTDATYGDGNSASSIWKVDFPLDEMELGLDYYSSIYVRQNGTGDPGIDSVKLFSGDTVTGPWTLEATGTSSNNYTVFIGSSSWTAPKYIKIEIDKQDGSENTLYPINLQLYQFYGGCV